MSFCPNCGNKIGCSCSGASSLTVASDGKQVCSKCVVAYEQTKALMHGLLNADKPQATATNFKH